MASFALGLLHEQVQTKTVVATARRNPAVAAHKLRQPDRKLACISLIGPSSTINDADSAIVMTHVEHLRWCSRSLEKAVNHAKIGRCSRNDNGTHYGYPEPMRLGSSGGRPLWGSCIAAFGFNFSGRKGPGAVKRRSEGRPWRRSRAALPQVRFEPLPTGLPIRKPNFFNDVPDNRLEKPSVWQTWQQRRPSVP